MCLKKAFYNKEQQKLIINWINKHTSFYKILELFLPNESLNLDLKKKTIRLTYLRAKILAYLLFYASKHLFGLLELQ